MINVGERVSHFRHGEGTVINAGIPDAMNINDYWVEVDFDKYDNTTIVLNSSNLTKVSVP